MPEIQTVYLFLSCPGDVEKDKLKLKSFIEDHNGDFKAKYQKQIDVRIWEEDAPDAFGPGRIQKKINRLIDQCHIFIGLMGKRFGGSTGLFMSGTHEEYTYAYHRWEREERPEIRFYFKKVSVPLDAPDEDFEQARKIREFQNTIKPQFFPDRYKSIRDLCDKVLVQLENILPRLQEKTKIHIPDKSVKLDALQAYRQYLAKKYRRISLFSNVDFDLAHIYVSLRLEKDPELWQDLSESELQRKKIRPVDARRQMEVLRDSEYGDEQRHTRGLENLSIDKILKETHRAVILGKPGAGKTTLFQQLAARYFDDAARLPVYLRIYDWVKCGLCDPVDALVQSLEKESSIYDPELLPSLKQSLKKYWQDGSLLFLLDGLDEVGMEDLTRVCETLQLLSFDKNTVLLSCRRAGYKAVLSRDFWKVFCINPFNKDERRLFMDNYFREKKSSAEHLSVLVEGRPRLRDLAEVPLLLGLICYVYEKYRDNEKEESPLPEGRGALYERCVNELLKRRIQQKYGDFSDFKLQVLRRFAYHFFTSADADEREWFSGEKLRDLIRRELESRPEVAKVIDPGRAGAFLHELVEANGLLLPAGADYYCFPHRSFQEYFAAGFLHKSKTGLQKILQKLSKDPFWTETICLYAGKQKNATKLINELGRANKVDLAVRMIPEAAHLDWNDLDPEKLNWKIRRTAVERLVLPQVDENKLTETIDLLTGILRKPDPSANVRYSALLALEKIGTPETLETVRNTWIIPPEMLEKNLPYTFSARGKSFKINGKDMPPNMIFVPGGSFEMGESKKAVTVGGFYMSVFPVTNREYEIFMKNGGYIEKNYWSTDGSNFLRRKKIKQPEFWNDRRFNHPLQPVVGVTFYEAEAYCRWLSQFLNAGRPFRLPTEDEWEHAARGPRGDAWAFGDWNPDVPRWDSWNDYGKGLTYGTSRINSVYKDSVSGFGLFDLSGNVWEWTDSWHERYKNSRVVRGGSWGDNSVNSLRSAYRDFGYPASWNFLVGFRCLQDSR
ncbi:SUMF1/EgtB/PvdO family nonheme iron enzyme [candidate division KSB1 bacterium]|nr:SUMF1/EgtB/PvdO family nonheme iron enzyme [candidate division KSB1 bacterium]